MNLEFYILTIAILSAIIVPISMDNNIVYSTSENENESENSENQKCYHSGFGAGQSGSYNQTQLNSCSNTGLHNAHAYYQGFIQGCIESGGGDYFSCNNKTPGPP